MKTELRDIIAAVLAAVAASMAITLALFEYMGWTDAIINWFA